MDIWPLRTICGAGAGASARPVGEKRSECSVLKKFVFRRILSGLLTVLVVFTLNFALVKSAPGDPITSLMGKETDDPVLRQALMEKWGLDKSYPEQYLSYLKNAASGDLGTSIIYNRSVNEMIGERVLATVLLGLTAALLALLLGTALEPIRK